MSAVDRISFEECSPLKGPLPFLPRLLSADHAAVYMGISKRNFLDRVSTHMLPAGRKIGARVLWDRHVLDQFIDQMFGLGKVADDKDPDDEPW